MSTQTTHLTHFLSRDLTTDHGSLSTARRTLRGLTFKTTQLTSNCQTTRRGAEEEEQEREEEEKEEEEEERISWGAWTSMCCHVPRWRLSSSPVLV